MSPIIVQFSSRFHPDFVQFSFSLDKVIVQSQSSSYIMSRFIPYSVYSQSIYNLRYCLPNSSEVLVQFWSGFSPFLVQNQPLLQEQSTRIVMFFKFTKKKKKTKKVCIQNRGSWQGFKPLKFLVQILAVYMYGCSEAQYVSSITYQTHTSPHTPHTHTHYSRCMSIF